MSTSNKIIIYPEEPCLLPVKFNGSPLEVYNKDYSDIENIVMSFKINATDALDAYLVKYYKDEQGVETGDILIDEAMHTFTLNKLETDVLNVNLEPYRLFIGVKVSGLEKMLWLRVDQASKIFVEQDGINE